MVIKSKASKRKMEAFINRGENLGSDESKWKKILIRIPNKMVEKLDTMVSVRPGLTRTALILEILQEKIRKK